MKNTLAAIAPLLLLPLAQPAWADQDWSGFYAGIQAGYGSGRSGLTIPGGGGTSTTACRTSAYGDIPLVTAPAGSQFDSELTGNQLYPASVASLLGLEQISESALYAPTTQTAFDFRGQTPYVADDECIFHRAYAFYEGSYYGGAQDKSGFKMPELPIDFRPSDLSGTIVTTVTPGAGDAVASARLSGLLGGVHAGWNHVAAQGVVLGAEADFMLSAIDGGQGVGVGSAATDIGWIGTLRARLGVARDRWLLYTTGGGALAGTKVSYDGGAGERSDSRVRLGWTLGGGAEFALTADTTVRVEYKHFDFGSAGYTIGGSNVKADIALDTVMIGVSRRF